MIILMCAKYLAEKRIVVLKLLAGIVFFMNTQVYSDNGEREKFLDLLEVACSEEENNDSENKMANAEKSPHRIINQVFIKIPKNDLDFKSRFEDTFYKKLIFSLAADIREIDTSLCENELIDILPSFFLYSVHNASVFPPLGEGMSQQWEKRRPFSYFRDMPFTSPIMDLYSRIVKSSLSRAYLKSKKDAILLQPMNKSLLDTVKKIAVGHKDNFSKIEVLSDENGDIIFKNNADFCENDWTSFFSLLTSSGLPRNNFNTIRCGIKCFLKYQKSLDSRKFIRSKLPIPKCELEWLRKQVSKLKTPSKFEYCEMYDTLMAHRCNVCRMVIEELKNHKFRHIKPFHVKNSQNLMIEVWIPPHVHKDYAAISESTEHVYGWVSLINGFLCGLINHYSGLEKSNIYTVIRDSYGFLRPTLALSGTSVRLSMGIQPERYSKIVAQALIDLDEVLEEFGRVLILKRDKSIFIESSSKEVEINLSEINSEGNIHALDYLMKANRDFLASLLGRKVECNDVNMSCYLLTMMKNSKDISIDQIAVSTPISQFILNYSYKNYFRGSKKSRISYLLQAFISYLNEMVISRVNLDRNNKIYVDSNCVLDDFRGNYVYYTNGFDELSPFANGGIVEKVPDVVIKLLQNMQFYLWQKLNKVCSYNGIFPVKLKNCFCVCVEELILNYKRITLLLENQECFSVSAFYNESVRLLEDSLEKIGILNSIYYFESPEFRKLTDKKNSFSIERSGDITNGVFICDWGEQADISAVLWLNDIQKNKETYLYTDDTTYFEVKKFQNNLKLKHMKEAKNNKKEKLLIYFFDPVPTIVLGRMNEEFKKCDCLCMVKNVIHRNNELNEGDIGALVIDVSSSPMHLQLRIYREWMASKNDKVKYLIFVVSGNKNSQLGLDKYQFGQISVYVKDKSNRTNFGLLERISGDAYNPLLKYLKNELSLIQGEAIIKSFFK